MRGRELLTDLPDSPVHAALSVEMAWTALIYAGDADTALQEARRAVEIASRAGDPTMRALAINAEGRALIQLGQIEEGLALLDESTVAAMTGELDGMATVVLFCSTICALQALAEYDRADQWTQAMEQWTADRPLGPFQGVCRVHRAEILRLRGAWHDAEREAAKAKENANLAQQQQKIADEKTREAQQQSHQYIGRYLFKLHKILCATLGTTSETTAGRRPYLKMGEE